MFLRERIFIPREGLEPLSSFVEIWTKYGTYILIIPVFTLKYILTENWEKGWMYLNFQVKVTVNW